MVFKIICERKVIEEIGVVVEDAQSAENILNVLNSQNSESHKSYICEEVIEEAEIAEEVTAETTEDVPAEETQEPQF